VTAEIAPKPRPTALQWAAAARPRTLPAAISPVVAATGIAAYEGGFALVPALLALVVALALQIGVNYANAYSDGIRGTDSVRVGPLRLVGSGLARPAAVRAAAFASFGVAALAGLVLVIITRHWWLLAVGVACVLAAWYYTGGKRPYGYRGLGELFVFVFFGLVATCGTGYVQTGRVSLALVAAAVGIGAFACAILVVNNLRDIDGDRAVGKRTLATRLGYRGTRALYVALVSLGAIMINVVAALTSVWALLGLLGPIMIIPAARTVLAGARGRDLIGALKATGLAELVAGIGLAVGMVIAAF
jgi:1,4-dihydroxy-2-naphthoate polyprenyltransferase